MNISETISVNPVSKTLGTLNTEATLEFIRNHTASAERSAKTSNRPAGKMLLASSTPGVASYGVAILLLRFLFAAMLIVSGSFILSGEIMSPFGFIDSVAFATGEIIIGGMLALGLLSRVAMSIAVLCFGYASFLSIEAGVFDLQSLLLCLGSSFFLIMGTGRFSCDFLIRKAIVLRRQRKERKLRQDRLTYRAYRIQNM